MNIIPNKINEVNFNAASRTAASSEKSSSTNVKNIFTPKNVAMAAVALSSAIGTGMAVSNLWQVTEPGQLPKFGPVPPFEPIHNSSTQCPVREDQANFDPVSEFNSVNGNVSQIRLLTIDATNTQHSTQPQPLMLRCNSAMQDVFSGTSLTQTSLIATSTAPAPDVSPLLLDWSHNAPGVDLMQNALKSPATQFMNMPSFNAFNQQASAFPFSQLDKIQTLFNSTQSNRLPHLNWFSGTSTSSFDKTEAIDVYDQIKVALSQTGSVLSQINDLPKPLFGKVIETAGNIYEYCLTDEGKPYCATLIGLATWKYSDKIAAPINSLKTGLKNNFKPFTAKALPPTLLASNGDTRLISLKSSLEHSYQTIFDMAVVKVPSGQLKFDAYGEWMRRIMSASLTSPFQPEEFEKWSRAYFDEQVRQMLDNNRGIRAMTWNGVTDGAQALIEEALKGYEFEDSFEESLLKGFNSKYEMLREQLATVDYTTDFKEGMSFARKLMSKSFRKLLLPDVDNYLKAAQDLFSNAMQSKKVDAGEIRSTLANLKEGFDKLAYVHNFELSINGETPRIGLELPRSTWVKLEEMTESYKSLLKIEESILFKVDTAHKVKAFEEALHRAQALSTYNSVEPIGYAEKIRTFKESLRAALDGLGSSPSELMERLKEIDFCANLHIRLTQAMSLYRTLSQSEDLQKGYNSALRNGDYYT